MKINPGQLVSKESFLTILKWPEPDILRFMLAFAQHSRTRPDDVALVPYINIPRKALDDPTGPSLKNQHTHVKDFGSLFAEKGKCRQHSLPDYKAVHRKMNDDMPWLKHMSFEGYVMAGSCPLLYASCHYDNGQLEYSPNDADFYLVIDKSTLDGNGAMKCYERCLKDFENAFEKEEQLDGQVLTRRNLNCTTIYNSSYRLQSMQIVHRVFSSNQAVVVGFDQIPCKVFYSNATFVSHDGESDSVQTYDGMTYFTLDAALAHYFGINPVDWQRESPSHMRRVVKYHGYGYCPIFPGLDIDVYHYLKDHHDKRNKEHGEDDDQLTPRTGFYPLPSCGIILNMFDAIGGNGKRIHVNNKVTVGYNLAITFNVNILQPNLEPDSQTEEIPENSADSDYCDDMEDDDINSLKGKLCYHNLSTIIKDKPQFLVVYCKKPTDIVSNYKQTTSRQVLLHISKQRLSRFYFGNDDVYAQRSVCLLLQEKKNIPMSDSHIEELSRSHKLLRELIDVRCTELDAKLNPVTEDLKNIRFNRSSPGAQFTASFNPIVRSHPRDYWGPMYKPFPTTFFPEQKMMLLTIRKLRKTILCSLDINMMKMLFWNMDQCQIDDVLSGRINQDLPKQKLIDTQARQQHGHWTYPYPWHYKKMFVVDRQAYLSKVVPDDSPQ